ncbi:MAG: ribonuclease E/G, partial [Rhizobacter sp.]
APIAEPAPLAAAVAAPVVAPAPVAPVAVAEPFALNTQKLEAVAESAGLQWVNSDADKIRAVQEAMAREPKPVHVPREIKAPVAIDEGPLVLVETRKDLSQVRLPFESNQAPSQPST